jgi:hypothetical protein
MAKLKEYIGKTFKGFKFEHEKHSLTYNHRMDEFIGKDLKIQHYYELKNSFETDSGCWYPADLVIAQLEKQTFKPERGDKVLVWDNKEEHALERIFLTETEGAKYPYVSVANDEEKNFINGYAFGTTLWKNMKPITEKVIPKDTLVWVKNHESSLWQQRFYSHFENGKHYCFLDQKKSNETENTTGWNIVTTENPFK